MNEYVNPIHYFIDDGLYWDMMPGIRKWTNVYIRENTANFQDNYIQVGDPDQASFHSIETTESSITNELSSGEILNVYFRYDDATDIYNRKIFSVIEMLSEIGGFFSS